MRVFTLAVLLCMTGSALCNAERLDTAATIVLENDLLRVELYADRPAPLCYRHKPTGEKMCGAGHDGFWRVNGQDMPWCRWRIQPFRRSDGTAAAYEVSLPALEIKFQVRFVLRENAIEMRFENIQDPQRALHTLEWVDMPLLTCRSAGYTYWREVWQETGAPSYWQSTLDSAAIADAQPDTAPRPTIHACVYKPDSLCAFVTSNCRILPLLDAVSRNPRSAGAGAYSLSLNTYYRQVRTRTTEALTAWVVFLQDMNGDDRLNQNDYMLWLNRRLPSPPDPTFKTALWYKILVGDTRRGVVTSFDQTAEIVERIRNVTNGLPQVCQLVRWQELDANVAYPELAAPSTAAGGPEKLASLITGARQECNTLVSCQTSLDYAYTDSPDWDGAVAALNEDGQPLVQLALFGRPTCRVSHTKQVESASIFRRLDALLSHVPLDGALHVQPFRGTNCNPQWEPERLGVVEEFYCGMLPILDHLRGRSIEVTTEEAGGMPLELAGVFPALWRLECPLEILPVYHGKIPAGQAVCQGLPLHYGGAIDSIVVGSADGFPGVLSAQTQWNEILDQVYLNVLLYHFYLEREWINTTCIPGGAVRVDFSGGATAIAGPAAGNLHVVARARDCEVTVADDGDRFVPRGDAIYAYSRDGSNRYWTLPAGWAECPLDFERLTPEGPAAEPGHKVRNGRVRLKLPPHTPVMITRQ